MSPRRLPPLLLGLAVLAAGAWLLRGYTTDDTFIHLRYARHLIERGEFSFNPGERTYGATSPLWIFGLALLLKLGAPPAAAARGLGLAAAALTLWLLDRLLARLGLAAPWRAAVVLLAAADAWFLRWGCSGMETPLAAALLLVLLLPAASGGAPAWTAARQLAWGAAAGLAALTRPEFMLLGPLAWPWLFLRRGARPAAPLAAAAGWLAVLGPWLLHARIAFGRWTPGTAEAKSFAPTLEPAALAASAAQSLQQLAAVQGPLWLALAGAILLWRLGARGGSPSPDRPPPPHGGGLCLVVAGIVATWTLALCGGYAVKQVWVISRYLSPLAPALLAAMAAVALRWRAAPARRARAGDAVLAAGALATLALNGWLLAARVAPHARDFSRGVRECLLPLGQRLRDHTPPDASVAALDIGALGYASERRVVDLAGLVSPEILELGRREGFAAMVASGLWLDVAVPDYLVDRTDGPPRWTGRVVRGVAFTLLDTCTLAGVGLREPQPWTVALYRLQRHEPPPPALDRPPPSAVE